MTRPYVIHTKLLTVEDVLSEVFDKPVDWHRQRPYTAQELLDQSAEDRREAAKRGMHHPIRRPL